MLFRFPFWGSLGLLLESVGQYNKLAFIKKTKDPEYVTSLLNKDFKKSISTCQVFEIIFWYLL